MRIRLASLPRSLSSVVGLVSLVGVPLAAAGCAEEDTLGTGGAGGSPSVTNTTGGVMTTTGSVTTGQGSTTTGSTSEGGGGSGEGGGGGEGGEGGGDPCAMGCPTDFWDVDNNPLTGDCGCEYACEQTSTDEDPIDDEFTDDNCDGGDGLVEQCVYVSVSQGSDANAGTRDMPMQSIAAALAQAQTNGVPAVCLSGETYQEAVTVIPGISIYGGFDQNDPDFKFRRKAGIITTVMATGTVFTVSNLTADTHIEGITIVANAPGIPGASTYGVRMATGGAQSTLYVRYNVMQIAGGTTGSPGADGTPHAQSVAPNGNNGTNGCSNCSGAGTGGAQPACVEFGGKGGNGGNNAGDGQAGSPGSGGAVGGGGSGSNNCATTSAGNAGTGSPGTPNGAQGMNGTGGAALGSVVAGLYAPANGIMGIIGFNGKGGGGGGGGGGGETLGGIFCNPDGGGGGGSGGCGGLGGNPGAGGAGGGGSFGVFVGGGNVIVTDNEITTGTGGAGCVGGNGATGQTGGAGGSPGGAADDSDPGGPGGAGSNGGAGGPGGGGGGGPSACLGRAAGAVFTFSGNSCTTGIPGFGGAGGTNSQGGVGGSGSTGLAAANLQIN